jgi:colanic acid biosynthesis protein WcaH
MTLDDAVRFLDECIPDKRVGLPDAVFYFISRTTPLVNVDLLVRDERGRTLLSWRDDKYALRGWHVPGGIVRYKESFEQRIHKTAIEELGADVAFNPAPLKITEMIRHDYENRAHFISVLFQCSMPVDFIPDNSKRNKYDPGYLAWHENCPVELLAFHDCYREFIGIGAAQ